MISLPLQNNTFFGIGPDDDTANVLNIQPVIPINLRPVNLINRTIVPLIYLPDVTAGLAELPEGSRAARLSVLATSTTRDFCRPRSRPRSPWGIGPSISFPTATDKKLGTEKWSAGPSAVALVQPGPFVIGTLVRQLWSFAGDDDRQDVSQLLIQPFANYNMAGGWFLTSAPIITANWEADSDDTWLVRSAAAAACSRSARSRSTCRSRPTTMSRRLISVPTGRCASPSRSCSRSERRRTR